MGYRFLKIIFSKKNSEKLASESHFLNSKFGENWRELVIFKLEKKFLKNKKTEISNFKFVWANKLLAKISHV